MSIPTSIKTRLLSASYTAACAVAERVFDLTEHLRVQEEDSYQHDLFNYRDKLAEELAEGKGRIAALAAHNDKVQFELDFVHREIYGPDFPTGVWKDYTEREQVPEGAGLTEPTEQVVAEDEAPPGCKAVACPVPDSCQGCAFDHFYVCPNNDGGPVRCRAEFRDDEQNVIFVKR